jgi:hypothetical protein
MRHISRFLRTAGVRWALAAAVLVATHGASSTVANAAVVADPTYTTSSRISGTPNQTLTYNITLTRTATFSYLVLALPAGAGTSGLQIGASNLRSGKLEKISGGFIYRTTTPYSIAAGTRLWVMVNGITIPPTAGTYSVAITAYDSSGVVMARGTTPGQVIYAPKACPGAWPSNYIATENALSGSPEWRLGTYDNAVASGFSSKVSAVCGDTVTFRINSNSTKLASVAYRMGYYGGAGARAVRPTSSWVRGFAQPAPLTIATDDLGRQINMTTARNWTQTYSLRIDGSFTPGDYLIKFYDVNNHGSYIPLTVRDDAGAHDKLVLNSVATWQAYNKFGGSSAYTGSTRISYDRPLLNNQGTGDFLSLEYGFVYWAEKQGYDLTYAADTDLNAKPQLYNNAKTLVLLSHSEYWSTAMRAVADNGVAAGKNLVSLGANQIYTRINLKPSSLTGADREYEVFRSGDTSRFRDAPNPNPEQSLLGSMFGCMHMTVGTATPNDSWLWQGVSKTPIPHLAAGEVDKVQSAYGIPAGNEILTTIPVDACNTPEQPYADIVARSTPSGGKVFNAGTHAWNCLLIGSCPYGWTASSESPTQIGQATRNIFNWVNTLAAPSPPQVTGVMTPSPGMPALDAPSED